LSNKLCWFIVFVLQTASGVEFQDSDPIPSISVRVSLILGEDCDHINWFNPGIVPSQDIYFLVKVKGTLFSVFRNFIFKYLNISIACNFKFFKLIINLLKNVKLI
jgi:hypothetical protein